MADDEEIIRRGFEKKIDWNSSGFEFLPPCKTGAELIESIKLNKPDVVFTDICMPEVDGLEVAAFISNNYPNIFLVILSGYDEFDYAQKAIKNRVYEYILKPINSKQLHQIVDNLKLNLDKETSKKEYLSKLKEIEEENKILIVEQFLLSHIYGNVNSYEIDNFLATIGKDYCNKAHSIITIEPDNKKESLQNRMTIQLLFLWIKTLFENNFFNCKIDCLLSPNGNVELLLSGINPSEIYLKSREVPELILKKLEEVGGNLVTIGIGKTYKSFCKIPMSHSQAIDALKNHFIYGRGVAIYFKDDCNLIEIDYAIINKKREILLDSFRSGSVEESTENINNYFSVLLQSNLPVRRVELEIKKLFLSILNILEELSIHTDISKDDMKLIELYESLPTIEESKMLVERILNVIFNTLKEQRKDFSEQKVVEVRRIIEKNYQNPDLTLESVCMELYISNGYLSRTFKKYTGITFIQYLTEFRINKAKEILKTTNTLSYEIADQVGYKDPQYFSTVFKKITGKTLSCYKKSLDLK